MSILAAGLIGAGVGALVGGSSFLWGSYQNNQKIREAKRRLEQQKAEQLKYMQDEWDVTQKNAFKSANQADTGTTLSEAVLGSSINGTLRNLGQAQEAQALGYNISAINAGSSEGASLDAIAQGGTRGSSALLGTEMASDLNAQSLEAQEEGDRLAGDLTLMGAMNTAAEGAYSLQTARTEANDLRTSYGEGGDAYNLFYEKKSNVASQFDRAIDELDDQMFYVSWSDLTSWEGWRDSILPAVTDVTLAGLQGAVSGFGLGASIGSLAGNAAAPATAAAADITFSPSALSSYNTAALNPTFSNLSPSMALKLK